MAQHTNSSMYQNGGAMYSQGNTKVQYASSRFTNATHSCCVYIYWKLLLHYILHQQTCENKIFSSNHKTIGPVFYHSVCIEVYNIPGPSQYRETNLKLKQTWTNSRSSRENGPRTEARYGSLLTII